MSLYQVVEEAGGCQFNFALSWSSSEESSPSSLCYDVDLPKTDTLHHCVVILGFQILPSPRDNFILPSSTACILKRVCILGWSMGKGHPSMAFWF